jgi:hypothetical protein
LVIRTGTVIAIMPQALTTARTALGAPMESASSV